MSVSVSDITPPPRVWDGSAVASGTRSYAGMRIVNICLAPFPLLYVAVSGHNSRALVGGLALVLVAAGFVANLLVRYRAARRLYETGRLVNATCTSFFTIVTARYGLFTFQREDGVVCRARMILYGPLIVGHPYACLLSASEPGWIGALTKSKGLMIGRATPVNG